MTEKRLQTDLLLNVPSPFSSPSSPRIIQEPPKGISFSEYLVVPRCVDSILGPIPTENSSTTMPFVFASKKMSELMYDNYDTKDQNSDYNTQILHLLSIHS